MGGAEYPVILDPVAMRALLLGAKTELRRLASSPLAACRPGDRLWVRESCVAARIAGPDGREESAKLRDAGLVVLADGWRRHRHGAGRLGPLPTNRRLIWTPAIQMPRWASRATLVVEAARIEPLRAMGRAQARAEGLRPVCGGLFWRWPPPARGLWRDPVRAFAAMWDRHHATPGTRWCDDPAVVVLAFRLER